jgi:hypothetical protein
VLLRGKCGIKAIDRSEPTLIVTRCVNFTNTRDETTKKLSFSYHVGKYLFFRVSYSGYFFLAGRPLFGQIGQVNPPTWNMLAGTWQYGFLPFFGSSSGWMARLAI